MTINAPAESSPNPDITGEPAVAAPPGWAWRRAALFLSMPGAADHDLGSGGRGSPASWPSLLLAMAPAPLVAAAAFAPVPFYWLAAAAGSAVLVAGIGGAWDHTGLFIVPALVALVAGGVMLWRERS